MSPFNCNRYLKECNACCCGVVPIESGVYDRHRHLLHREVIHEFENIDVIDAVLPGYAMATVPVTSDMICPFLQPNFQCAIHDHRPQVCRDYGTQRFDQSNGAHLNCPMQKHDGTPRQPHEKKTIINTIKSQSNTMDHFWGIPINRIHALIENAETN